MKLIGINGFKRSGKGETAKIIAEAMPTAQVGFADSLKAIAALALGYSGTREELIAAMDDFKELNQIEIWEGGNYVAEITGRQYLQNLGNEARGVFGDTFWIDQVLPNPAEYTLTSGLDAVARKYPGVECVAITDLRYPNEAQRVKDLGGTVVEVIRPGRTSDGHASEQPLPRDLVDYTILNDGTLDELRTSVAAFLVTV